MILVNTVIFYKMCVQGCRFVDATYVFPGVQCYSRMERCKY